MATLFHLPGATASSLLLVVVVVVVVPLLSSGANDTGFEMGPAQQSHIHFFLHNIISGSNPTGIRIAAASPNTTATGFGSLVIIDNPLTEGPKSTSKLLGNAQGVYATSSMQEPAPMMTINLYFSDGDWKGSSLAIVGRNAMTGDGTEMPVVGGSGRFRWADGYASTKTKSFDRSTGDATTEYDVYVTHRCSDQSKCSSASANNSPAGNSGGGDGGRSATISAGYAATLLLSMMAVIIIH